MAASFEHIAQALFTARLQASAIPTFPGTVPATLEDAYAIQRLAIALWPDRIAGWKVGRLSPDLAQRFGQDRFVGPVFQAAVRSADPGTTVDYASYAGGSAMFEAEYMLFAGHDDDGVIVVDHATTGVEVAASPIADLPALGSLATIADLGNNAGQIIGAPVPLDSIHAPSSLACETRVGTNDPVSRTADALPGGPMAAFAFAVVETARLGFPLQPGQFVTTGAVTGMNPVEQGQTCVADFAEFGQIDCIVTGRPPIKL